LTTVVFLLVPRLHLLDLAGPAQVFSTADEIGCGYRLEYVGEQEGVPTAQGVALRASTQWPDLGPGDLVVVPGWQGRYAARTRLSADTRDALIAHHAAGGTVASVCAGAFALAQVGLLDGRRSTTHHALQDLLAATYPATKVQRDVLYVVDDRVITSAGIASGIDLALHLIAMRHGAAVAARVARSMVVYARRNGDDPQHSAMLRHRAHLSDAVHRAQDIIDARFDERLPLDEVAAACDVSPRTLTRMFTAATGMTPLRYQHTLRLERAENLIARGSTVDAAARACGFDDARMLRRLRARGLSAVPAAAEGLSAAQATVTGWRTTASNR
jgi:transcriptional regulator GlxA family with amidase domain